MQRMCRSDLRTEKCDGAKEEVVRKTYHTVWREGIRNSTETGKVVQIIRGWRQQLLQGTG